jgi:hypothetical protein
MWLWKNHGHPGLCTAEIYRCSGAKQMAKDVGGNQ